METLTTMFDPVVFIKIVLCQILFAGMYHAFFIMLADKESKDTKEYLFTPIQLSILNKAENEYALLQLYAANRITVSNAFLFIAASILPTVVATYGYTSLRATEFSFSTQDATMFAFLAVVGTFVGFFVDIMAGSNALRAHYALEAAEAAAEKKAQKENLEDPIQ